mmetsp:Transcript_69770/g.187967  ORF Transcript_69770/g.187967 Transcript_69770/m.187967 type:complete len:271 (+) Transcript_69770:548-1360(+)
MTYRGPCCGSDCPRKGASPLAMGVLLLTSSPRWRWLPPSNPRWRSLPHPLRMCIQSLFKMRHGCPGAGAKFQPSSLSQGLRQWVAKRWLPKAWCSSRGAVAALRLSSSSRLRRRCAQWAYCRRHHRAHTCSLPQKMRFADRGAVMRGRRGGQQASRLRSGAAHTSFSSVRAELVPQLGEHCLPPFAQASALGRANLARRCRLHRPKPHAGWLLHLRGIAVLLRRVSPLEGGGCCSQSLDRLPSPQQSGTRRLAALRVAALRPAALVLLMP